MAIAKLTEFSPDEAGWRVTDAKFDDCIDGFAIRNGGTEPPTLYLVQTKLALAGKTKLGWRDVSDLFEGFARLRHNQLHQNNRLRKHLPDIRDALRTVGARCVLVWATCGELPSPEAERDARDRRARLATEGLRNVECRFLYLEDFLRELDQELAPPGVTVSGEFLQDHRLDEQDKSLQGAISAAVLGQWYLEHDQGLFDENVRVGKESAVNREIAVCLRDEPQNFWYFHDGITALCEDWDRALDSQPWVPFTFRGLRIVNGAQTVTTIGGITGYDEHFSQKPRCQSGSSSSAPLPRRFGSRIAHATNRNNPMTPRELLALHHVQQRLRDEFMLAWSLTYAIRADDPLPAAEDGCPALEAVIAP